MKIADIEFKRVGCCGEYLNAQIELNDGVQVVITDHENETYTAVIIKNGFLIGKPHANVTAKFLEDLISTL